MLKEIKCNKFIEETIKFSDGLNTILGDDLSTNSIGKSTLLMIIDFVFGGNSFLTKDSGSVKELGHLTFYFSFDFKKELTYFSRNTEFPDLIQICDKDYNSITEITLSKFTNSLKENYNLKENYLSFRSVVSTFSRIWGKDNYNVDKPLQSFLKEPESTSVTNIVKLFKLYNLIAETETQIKEQEETNTRRAGGVPRAGARARADLRGRHRQRRGRQGGAREDQRRVGDGRDGPQRDGLYPVGGGDRAALTGGRVWRAGLRRGASRWWASGWRRSCSRVRGRCCGAVRRPSRFG